MTNNNNFKSGIGDILMTSFYVKYDRLKDLVDSYYKGSKDTNINIYIDMQSVINTIKGVDPVNGFIDEFSISSYIINMCAHYRNFFRTRYRVETKIWIIYSDNSQGQISGPKICPGYHTSLYNISQELKTVVHNNMCVLSLLCPYIPDVGLVIDTVEPVVTIRNMILNECQNGNTSPNIIISRDALTMQLVSLTNNVVLFPMKHHGEDNSIFITPSNVIEFYIQRRNVKVECSGIPNIFLPLIFAATRFPERGLKSINNIPTVMLALRAALTTDIVTYNNMITAMLEGKLDVVCNTIYEKTKFDIKYSEVLQRLKLLHDGVYSAFQPTLYMPMVNLYDKKAVQDINNEYFSKVPLDLMSL